MPVQQLGNCQRLRVVVRGAVQGVGFRSFVYRLATEMELPGWVLNSAAGVFVEVEGAGSDLDQFLLRLEREAPARAIIQSVEASWHAPRHFRAFEIRSSDPHGAKHALILPDIATCDACRADIFDPANRRYRYPFTNCTHCGPRYTIIERLPYDRANSTMRRFQMCAACRTEYESPLDRRFHAQPNACPECGPQLALWDRSGHTLAERDDALRGAVAAIRRGEIVAVKGLGGFHLIADATNNATVQRLRLRKGRPDKPFAIMAPHLAWVTSHLAVDPLETSLLSAPEAPIVLLTHPPNECVAASVAPTVGTLGVMLPYTPLHHLLMAEFGGPVVATSGNRSDEPIVIDEQAALRRLGDIADSFLVHNRPIVRPVDDSVVRLMAGAATLFRRARGYAPLPFRLPQSAPEAILAVGGQQKNTIGLAVGQNAFISQHLGNLDSAEAMAGFQDAIRSFEQLYEVAPTLIAHDAHPDYSATRYARQRVARQVAVSHHYAHLLAGMTEHRLAPPLLGVAWDGTGDGGDGTVWGGEFLRVGRDGSERVATLRPFRLLGGEKAVREPRRCAVALLWELFGDDAATMTTLAPVASFTPSERTLLMTMARQGINSPQTTSVGRLFDAVAALVGGPQCASFEGQAAMALEGLAAQAPEVCAYPFPLLTGEYPYRLDWGPLIHALIADLHRARPPAEMAAAFHHALSAAIVAVATAVGEARLLLTGGCFQNKFLVEETTAQLRAAGFTCDTHHLIPPNDGGIALGQLVAAMSGGGR